jgi:hypothetical protein
MKSILVKVYTYSVTNQYLKKFSYGFWDNQWFWSEPNISQIEAWSSTIYSWYQEFEFKFFFEIFLISNEKISIKKLQKLK